MPTILPAPLKSLFAALFVATTLAASSSTGIDYGDFPVDRLPPSGWEAYEFTDPGNWVTVEVTQHGLPKDDPNVDASAQIPAILSEHGSNENVRLYFPAGTYYLKSMLTIERGNLWIDGDTNAAGQPASIIETDGRSVFRVGFHYFD